MIPKADLGRRHQKTLAAIAERPTRSNVRWADVEALFSALGAERHERRGSRVCFVLGGKKAILHRPHPGPVINRATVRDIEQFLVSAGVET